METVKPVNTISVRFEVCNDEKAMRRINHNNRITVLGRKSVVKKLSNDSWVMRAGKFWQLNKIPKSSNKDLQGFWKKKLQSDAAFAKTKVNDKNNISNKSDAGRIMRWGHLKHNTFIDGIVGFGSDWQVKDLPQDELVELAKQAEINLNKYFKSIGGFPVSGFVIHLDEAGNGHFHFQARNTNKETGASLALHMDNKLSLAQDAIFENMARFKINGIPLTRGEKYSENNKRRRYMSVDQYKQFMDAGEELKILKAEVKEKDQKLQEQDQELKEKKEDLKVLNEDEQIIKDILKATHGQIESFLEVFDMTELNEKELKEYQKIEGIKDFLETKENITAIQVHRKNKQAAKSISRLTKTIMDANGNPKTVRVKNQTQTQAQGLEYKKINVENIKYQSKQMAEWIHGQKEMDENWKDYEGEKFLLIVEQYITKGIDPAIHDKIISMAKDSANAAIAFNTDNIIINYRP